MKHVLAIYGKMKGKGKNRKNVPIYIGPTPLPARVNFYEWVLAQKKEQK